MAAVLQLEIVAPMLSLFGVRVGWTTLLARTVRETIRDDASGLAAQLGYYFFLSLFPALLFFVALAGLFPLQHLTDEIILLLQPIAPREVIAIVQDQMLAIANSPNTKILSVGLLGTLWTSSAAMGAVINAMNRAYDTTERRPWWYVKLLAVLLTTGLALFILISLTLVVAGPELADWLAARFGLSAVSVWVWKIVLWPLVFVLVATAVGLIYYFAPDAEQDWKRTVPGCVLATTLWLLGSLGFRYYVVNIGNYAASYGTIGAFIVLLLWFYLTGLVIVIGAELNAEIERESGRTAAII